MKLGKAAKRDKAYSKKRKKYVDAKAGGDKTLLHFLNPSKKKKRIIHDKIYKHLVDDEE